MGELDGGGADAAPDGVDHHRLAGLQPSPREEHVPRGAEGDLDGGRLLVRELVGDADQVFDRARQLLRVAARGREADEAGRQAERLAAGAAVAAPATGVHQVRQHPLADLPALNPLAERGDPADDLDAEDERRLDRKPGHALADVDVEVVERAGADLE